MKKTSEVTLLLISLFLNIIISFLLGYKYKNQLISLLSEPIYYQIIIFISLTAPVLIKKIDATHSNWRFNKSIKTLQESANKIDRNKLDDSEKEMLDEMTNRDVATGAKIRELYAEMKRKSQ
ncbi:hypothetical protein [Salmonella enterica]|uniref:hypothetical protein n=1 Tax=Salmonella enterica TaxID=28901 RepID=UPI0009A94CFA|nr:hypothetical protein [Salmonella enterica]EAO2687663.1 hypothetical protein [Salmonella enterica]